MQGTASGPFLACEDPYATTFFFLLVGMTNFVISLSCANCQTAKEPSPAPASSPALKFSYGQQWNSCGPVDDPIEGMTLATARSRCGKASYPQISVLFSYPGDKSASVSVQRQGNYQTAKVSRCLSDNSAECSMATGGTINFPGAQAGRHASPTYELQFSDGSVEKGSFTVKSCFRRITGW